MRTSWPLRGAVALAIALVLSLGAAAVLAAGSSFQPTGEPGQPVIIRWSTESEVNTAGYNLYRAVAEEGPWEKLNPRLIPGSLDPLRGGSYVFTDTNVIAGVAYWYELEEVELSGQATRLQRTKAVAQPQNGSLGTLPCGAILLPGVTVAMGGVFAARRRALSGISQ